MTCALIEMKVCWFRIFLLVCCPLSAAQQSFKKSNFVIQTNIKSLFKFLKLLIFNHPLGGWFY